MYATAINNIIIINTFMVVLIVTFIEFLSIIIFIL
jgi:hypothetical protein